MGYTLSAKVLPSELGCYIETPQAEPAVSLSYNLIITPKHSPINIWFELLQFGAGDRGRTDTVSLPLDFESSTSANSITPANISGFIRFLSRNGGNRQDRTVIVFQRLERAEGWHKKYDRFHSVDFG